MTDKLIDLRIIWFALAFLILSVVSSGGNKSKPFMAKCCGFNEVLQFPNCVPSNRSHSFTDRFEAEVHSDETCGFGMYHLPKSYWSLSSDSKLNIQFFNPYANFSNTCMDVNENGDLQAFICITVPYRRTTSDLICLCISTICLAVAIFIYFIPEIRKRHGNSTLCYLFCFTMTISLSFFSFVKKSDDSTSSTVIGFMATFFSYCSFTWASIMSMDVFLVIRHLPDSRISNYYQRVDDGQSSRWKKFRIYCIVAFGAPVIMEIILIVCSLTEALPMKLRPNIVGWFSEFILLGPTRFVARAPGEFLYIGTYFILNLTLTFTFSVLSMLKYRRIKKVELAKFGNSYNPNLRALATYKSQVLMNCAIVFSIIVSLIGRAISDAMELCQLENKHAYKFFRQLRMLYSCSGIFTLMALIIAQPASLKKFISYCKKRFFNRNSVVKSSLEQRNELGL